MCRVLLIFRTKRFQQIAVRQQVLLKPHGERPGVGLRIVKGQIDRHASKIDAVETLGQVQGLTMCVAARVEPAAVIKTLLSTTKVSPSQRPTE